MHVVRHNERERERKPRIYCQYRVFLYIHVVRHNEREGERLEYFVIVEFFCTCMLYVITRERPEYIVSIGCFCTCIFYVITREREIEARIYCQYRIFLYMHVVLHNERERERPEYIVSVECFCTCMLYVITRQRERERPVYIVSIECLCTCMLYVKREREGESGTNIMSGSGVSIHAWCTS